MFWLCFITIIWVTLTLKRLKNISCKCWSPRLQNYVSNKAMTGKQEGLLHSIEKITIPMHTIHIDHLGPFVRSTKSNLYLIASVDAFMKFLQARPVSSTKVKLLLGLLENIFWMFGTPRQIICDRGAPHANRQVERYNSILLNDISTSSEEKR